MLTRDKVVGIIRIRKVVLSVPVWTIVSACINRFAIKKSHLLVKPVPGYAICGQTKQRACDVWQCQVSVLLSALFPRATVGIVVRTLKEGMASNFALISLPAFSRVIFSSTVAFPKIASSYRTCQEPIALFYLEN